MNKVTRIFIGLAMLGISSTGFAEGQNGRHERPPHGKPPQEAFDACASAAAGDTCEVSRPDREPLAGICDMPPREEVLLCIPLEHRRGPAGDTPE